MKILCGFSFKRTYRVNHGLKMMKTLLYAQLQNAEFFLRLQRKSYPAICATNCNTATTTCQIRRPT